MSDSTNDLNRSAEQELTGEEAAAVSGGLAGVRPLGEDTTIDTIYSDGRVFGDVKHGDR